MISLLLAVIYTAFISLGLPDALLGSAWPIMHAQMNVPLSYAGIVTFTHPRTGERMTFTAELPEEFLRGMKAHGIDE